MEGGSVGGEGRGGGRREREGEREGRGEGEKEKYIGEVEEQDGYKFSNEGIIYNKVRYIYMKSYNLKLDKIKLQFNAKSNIEN